MADQKKYTPIYVCPKCGCITFLIPGEECDICALSYENMIKTNFTTEVYNQMDKAQTKEWKEMLRKRYVLTPDNPFYNKEAYYYREDREFQSALERENFEKKLEAQKQQSTSSPALICPKCGSKNFTPVPRKWSFLTGFMTNKVDMVCNNCGWVKKG